MADTNRRLSPRQESHIAIQVLMNSGGTGGHPRNLDLIPGKICNQSRDGLYIEMDRILEPGSNVSIKIVPPEDYQPENPYFVRDGRVIWCQKIDDPKSLFGIGIKVLRKFVQADVLTSRFR
jgi:hypothetical protein